MNIMGGQLAMYLANTCKHMQTHTHTHTHTQASIKAYLHHPLKHVGQRKKGDVYIFRAGLQDFLRPRHVRHECQTTEDRKGTERRRK